MAKTLSQMTYKEKFELLDTQTGTDATTIKNQITADVNALDTAIPTLTTGDYNTNSNYYKNRVTTPKNTLTTIANSLENAIAASKAKGQEIINGLQYD